MTPKYLQKAIDGFKEKRKGILTNAEKWVNMPITLADMDNVIAELEKKADEMDTLNTKLAILTKKTHDVINNFSAIGSQSEKLAKGLHALETSKLHDYGIKLPKSSKKSLPIPGQAVISKISNDVDGEGFIIHIQFLPDAYDYEIWRAVAADGQELTENDFAFVTTTKRLVYTDNEVVKNKRYYYRVRGYNRKGRGMWSNVSNKVQ